MTNLIRRVEVFAAILLFLVGTASGGYSPASSSVTEDDWSGDGVKAGTRKTLTIDGIEYAFCWCPAGSFLMGSPEDEEGRFGDETQHEVTLSQGFWMLETEVTVGMFRSFMKATGYKTGAGFDGKGGYGYNSDTNEFELGSKYTWENPGFPQTETHPVTEVDWAGTQAFCDWLSQKSGRKISLPSEAQWEYACRAGSTTAYHFGSNPEDLPQNGNVADASMKKKFPDRPTISGDDGFVFTAPVKSYAPNAWGLYDMHGNVYEWCLDYWGSDYENLPSTDPLNTSSSSSSGRVYRGGSWDDFAGYCRSAYRDCSDPSRQYDSLGFRFLLSSSSK